MNEQQIVEEVNRYLVDKSYQYAILIEGERGCGKTYFVKNRLTQEINNLEKNRGKRKIKYISLYGCKSIDEIKEAMAWTFAEEASKFSENKGKISQEKVESILSTSKSIISRIREKILPDVSITNIIANWIMLKNYIFIFDDLERCDCPINEVFGFINGLVEHEETKVILVANEKEISIKENRESKEMQYMVALNENIDWSGERENIFEQNKRINSKINSSELEKRRELLFQNDEYDNAYKKIREKLIGVTLHYDPDIKIICEKIIGNGVENNTLKNELLNYSDMFCNYMEQYSHNNLRTFQFFISKVSYLVKKMEQASIKDYEIEVRKYIIEETFICAIEYKSNYQEPSEEWKRALIKVRPRMLSVKMYVETGQFIYKNFNKELNKYVDEQILNNIDSQDPLNLLSNYYYENSQKWCEDKIDEIKGKLKDNKYPTFSYGRILICVQCLIDIGFELSIEEFKRLMSINISKTDRLYEIDLINLKFENPKIRDKIINDITDINKFILNKKNKNKAKSVREILKDEDWTQELENIIDEYNIVYDSDVNIFHEISVSELKNTVINSSSENIIKFRRILNSLYPLDYCRKVNCLDDVVLLKELRENIDPQEINDLIVRKNLEWLIEQIKETETIYLNK